jgi:energy-coupling factor transporter ATP-binding protein EcfA2
MDPLDARTAKLHEILAWSKEFGETVTTEADTRFKIIDRVLTEVLGWPRENISTEEETGGGKLDYKLAIDGANKAVVEAKREAVSFGLSHRNSGQAYKLSGSAFEKAGRDAVCQTIGYCAFKNAELACTTNGMEWIVFRANRLGDGRETLDGKGFVFASLDDIAANFALFFDLLGFNNIKGMKFRGLFQEAEGLPLRDLSFFRALRTPATKRMLQRGHFAIDFDEIMNSFFQRLKGEEDSEMVVDCFVITDESQLADAKLQRVAEDLVQRMRQINSRTGVELQELIESVQRQHKNRFVLLVGNKGAGKSTFIDRFFKYVLPSEISDGLVTVRLDMALCDGSASSVVDWLNTHLLQECEAAVFTDNAASWDETIGSMFFDEYQRWSVGSMKHLYETNREQFRIEFGRHVEQLRKDQPHDVIKRLLKNIVRSRKRIPCLIFDNTDHHNIAFQENVFQYARSIYESELCLVIIPITDKTSWQLSRQGALQSFESEVLYLPVPQPHRVIERRISYLVKKLDQNDTKKTQEYFFGRNIRLDIANISAFAASLNRIFVESRRTSEWLGGLVNYDIRRLLELTRDVIASPHMPFEDLLKAHIIGNTFAVPEWKIKNAITKRRYDIYPEGEHPFVQNIFNLSVEVPTTPLLGVRILQFLRDAQEKTEETKRDFVPVDELYDHLTALGIERRVTTVWLQGLLRTGLVLDYDPTVTDVEGVSKVEISPGGKVHLIWGTSDEDYLKVMKEVTPLRSKQTLDELRYHMERFSTNWAKALAVFVDYLVEEDSKWCLIPEHSHFDGQRSITKRLNHVKNAALQVRR